MSSLLKELETFERQYKWHIEKALGCVTALYNGEGKSKVNYIRNIIARNAFKKQLTLDPGHAGDLHLLNDNPMPNIE